MSNIDACFYCAGKDIRIQVDSITRKEITLGPERPGQKNTYQLTNYSNVPPPPQDYKVFCGKCNQRRYNLDTSISVDLIKGVITVRDPWESGRYRPKSLQLKERPENDVIKEPAASYAEFYY
jgi:hypothetical protein